MPKVAGTFYHEDKQGRIMALDNMSDDHLAAVIKLIENKAKEGAFLHYAGLGWEDMEVEIISGDGFKRIVGYQYYVEERDRRKKQEAKMPRLAF